MNSQPPAKPSQSSPSTETGAQRLQKLLAGTGLGSRRSIEQWIADGRITVNGRMAKLGDRATAQDTICLDGKPLAVADVQATAQRVLMYHKPVGEVSTRSDPQRRPTVFENLPRLDAGRWITIGRLDVMTSGLLLFTTDGELAHRLMHPSNEVEREYWVQVKGRPGPTVLQRLLTGVELEDGSARFDRLQTEDSGDWSSFFKVTLHEGRNREVRRIWAAVGHEVMKLVRVRYGPIELPRDLPPGKWRDVAQNALKKLAAI